MNCDDRVANRLPLATSRFRLLVLLMVTALALTGCVRRRLFVRSTPAGALVYVDNEQIGTTPCAVDFTYYGTREIRLVKPGYETLTVNQPIPTPWYEFPPLDFISENLVPYKIRDNRAVNYNLMPQQIIPDEELIARGNQLRRESLQGTVLPATASGSAGGAIPDVGVGTRTSGGTSLPQGTVAPMFGPPPDVEPIPLGTPPPIVLPAPPGALSPTIRPSAPAQSTGPGPGRPLVSPPLR